MHALLQIWPPDNLIALFDRYSYDGSRTVVEPDSGKENPLI